jgi:CBS domain containing-hemolysin-like protein
VTPLVVGASVVLLLANAFFVAVEFGLVASRQTELEATAATGDRRARRVLASLGRLDRQLAGAQLGITLASLALGAVAVPALADALDGAVGEVGAAAIALGVVVLAHVVVGELVPKHIAIAAPERTVLALGSLHQAYLAVVGPVVAMISRAAGAIVRLFGVQPGDEVGPAHTPDELARLLADSRRQGVLESMAHDLLSGALDLGGTRLAAIAVDRDDVVSVPVSTSVERAEAVAVERGVSRLILTGRQPDDVAGFVHVKDLLTVPAAARRRPVPVGRVRRVLFLDASLPLDRVLLAMRRARTHVAVVVDPPRRFVGLATLEDVLEEVVGDITDESDARPGL